MTEIIKRAFLVGINYRGSEYELGGCINDVIMMKEVLINHYNYKEENILLLSDDTENKPTRENILYGWEWLLSNTKVEDFKKNYEKMREGERGNYVFHYSGHGSQVKDTSGDEEDGEDETICPIDFKKEGMIIDDDIREKLAIRVPENSQLISIIDACHSESSFDLLWTAKSTILNKIMAKIFGRKIRFELVKEGKYDQTMGDVIVLSGCKDKETSADIKINGKGNGALTYALIQVLQDANYNIKCDELLINIRKYIKKNKLSNQLPCLSFGKSIDISHDFIL